MSSRAKFLTALAVLILAVCALSVPGIHAAEEAGPVIRLPLTFHLVGKLEVPVAGRTLTGWISPDDVRRIVMPDINRIWEPAGIEWDLTLIDVVDDKARDDQLISALASNTREGAFRLPSVQFRRATLELERSISSDRFSYQVIVLPYMGKGLRGVSYDGREVAFLSEWDDLRPGGVGEPVKSTLAGRNSFAHVVAHELGHLLGLNHDACDGDCLMRSVGFRLTEDEIRRSRDRAAMVALSLK